MKPGTALSLLTVGLFLAPSCPKAQSLYNVSVNTSRIKGTSGKLIFEITSNRPLTNRVDILNFYTDGKTELAETQGSLVTGDLIENTQAARYTRIKAYGFFTELIIPFTAFGEQISFGLNVSEIGPLGDLPPDMFSVLLLDREDQPLASVSDRNAKAMLALTINGERGGRLEQAVRESPRAHAAEALESGAAAARHRPPSVELNVASGWSPDDPQLIQNAKTFEGPLTEFCNRRCDGALICTGGAFGIRVDEDTFLVFDDVGNLKTQVALLNAGRNPLGEGDIGRARVSGVLNKYTITVREVEVF